MNKDLILKKGDIVTYLNCANNKKIVFIKSSHNEKLKDFEGLDKVLKVERPIKYKTIYEVKEILDEKEKEYLRNVIRPFRNRIGYIAKHGYLNETFIEISIIDDEFIDLPYFNGNDMYKNMEYKKEYTLEELGL